MPTTLYNVEMIRRRAPNYTPEEILQLMDELQQYVYSKNSFQTLKIDPTTGNPPYLTTVDGQFQYDCPADCRRTDAVFTTDPLRFYGSAAMITNNRQYWFNGTKLWVAPVDSRDATPGKLATITFRGLNPGNTTTTFYHSYYVLAAELSDPSVQLTIPDHLHFKFRAGVLKLLQSEDYGETGSEDAMIEKIAKNIRNDLNAGQRTGGGQTQLQPDHQSYGYFQGRGWRR